MAGLVKYEMEFILKTSIKVLYNMLSTPSGLSEWFADDVNIRKEKFTFIWDGEEEEAELVGKRANEYVKFHWVDSDDEKSYFEFRIEKDSMTGEVALNITDFAEEDEMEEAQLLWESNIAALKQVLGSQ